MRIGQPVTFTVDALNGETFHGKGAEYLPGDREFSAISPGQRYRQLRQDRPAHPGASRLTRGSATASARAPACRCR